MGTPATGLLPRERTDVALMLLLLVPSLFQVALDPIASRPVGVAVALASVVPVAWRRTSPAGAAVAGSAAWLIPTEGFLILGYVVAVILFFSVGAFVGSLRVQVLTVSWGIAAGTVGVLQGPEDPVTVLAAWLVVAASVVAGRLVARQRVQNARLEELTQQLAREHGLVARSAVAEERARIARELHDVVGHEVTLISIQSEAAASALHAAPELAEQPIHAIRETAHRAGAELRALVGLLDAEGSQSIPVAGPAGLAEIVERAASLGIANTFQVTGTQWSGEQSVWLAVNRIVQEALTNAGRHAPGSRVAISVDWTPAAVSLAIRNSLTAPPREPGFGILGMAERARLLRGTLSAGIETPGVFEVSAVLPATERGGA